jgi:hypothetical protein
LCRPFNLLPGFNSNGDSRTQMDRPGTVGRNTDSNARQLQFGTRFNF